MPLGLRTSFIYREEHKKESAGPAVVGEGNADTVGGRCLGCIGGRTNGRCSGCLSRCVFCGDNIRVLALLEIELF